MADPIRALELLERLGFKRNPYQAVRRNSLGLGTDICFVHPGTGVEFELNTPQWELLEPYFVNAEGSGVERVAELRAAALSALEVIEEQIAPGRAVAEGLRKALEP